MKVARRWLEDPRWAEIVVLLLVCSATAGAAAAAFPVMDDAYLDLVLRENGPAGVLEGHRDRPAVALLLSATARVFGGHFWTFVFVANAILWTVLGIQTCALWRMMIPDWRRYAIAAGLLAVSPIVVQIQFCTATVGLFGVLSVVVAYGALFAIIHAVEQQSRLRFVFGLLLGFLAVLLTEYAVAAICAAAVLIAFGVRNATPARRREFIRGAIALIGVAALAYGAFLLVSDVGGRPEVDPRQRLKSFDSLESFPFSLASRAWQVLIGAYGSAFGRLWVERDSASTIVAAVFGFLISGLVLLFTRKASDVDPPPGTGVGRIRVLFLSVIAGIIPVAAMRPYAPHPFATRFNLPVLPGAVILTLACGLWVVKPRFRSAVVALLTFVAGTALFADCWDGVRHRKQMQAVGDQIRRSLPPEGLTAVVVSSDRMCESPDWCTGQATLGWPVELEKRVWVYDVKDGTELFGGRAAHRSPPPLDVDVRSVRRAGPVREVLWVEPDGDGYRVEPYFGVVPPP